MPIDILAHAVIKSTHQSFSSRAIAHTNPAISRTTAVTVSAWFFPLPISRCIRDAPLLRLPHDGADLGATPTLRSLRALLIRADADNATPTLSARDGVGVARLRDRTPTAMGTRGLFRVNQSDLAHEVTRCLEPSVVSHLRRIVTVVTSSTTRIACNALTSGTRCQPSTRCRSRSVNCCTRSVAASTAARPSAKTYCCAGSTKVCLAIQA